MSTSTDGVPSASRPRTGRFSVGEFLAGLFVGLIVVSAFIYAATATGGVSLVVHGGDHIAEVWYWLTDNLGSSIIAFSAIFVLYVYFLLTLQQELGRDKPSESRLITLDHRLDLLAGVCFGIGVLFTAIGLRAALLGALGGLDETAARELGAFNILRRLVNGGILLALSTTIVGGIAGYAMRVVKNFWLGGRLIAFYQRKGDTAQQQILTRLEAIEIAAKSSRGAEDGVENGAASDC